MDAVATSTLHQEQSRPQLARRKLYNSIEDKVATTPCCRDINCTEERSRQHQDVATTIVQRRGRNNKEAPTTRTAIRPATRTATRTDVVTRALCRDNISLLGQFTKVQKEMHRN